MIYKEELSYLEDNDISYFIALVAQVVEQSPEKACVGGSSPAEATNPCGINIHHYACIQN